VIRIGTPLEGRYGYIDKSGRMVIEPQFGNALFFSGGLADASLPNGTTGYIDKSGKFVWSKGKRNIVSTALSNNSFNPTAQ
jgi:WG containing repeat